MQKKQSDGKKKDTFNKKINSLKTEIEKLKQELNDKNDKLLRSYADLQNYQKRVEKELQLKEEETKKKYICELIDLSELLKKAYEDKDPKEGLKLILNNIQNFFEKEQIKCINCVGEKFDHNLHHAVTIVEKDDCEDNSIIDEIKKGYIMNDKILRPSHVVVAKKKK